MGIDQQATARRVLTDFLRRAGKTHDGLADETSLFGDGLELDSLESAELSALLEDANGADPFSDEDSEMPQTVGDILSFYAVR